MNVFQENIRFLLERDPSFSSEGLSDQFRTAPTINDLVRISDQLGYSIDALIRSNLATAASFDFQNIRFLVLDVDGVMTDGGMYYSEGGDEFKKFNTKDGMGIKKTIKKGLHVGIISSGINQKLIEHRGHLLGIQHIHVGRNPKLPVLEKWCSELSFSLSEVAYIGDDINDLEVMGRVGFAACPSDALVEVQQAVHLVLRKKGGEGCIREFVDTYLLK